jgi:hypothetical protein
LTIIRKKFKLYEYDINLKGVIGMRRFSTLLLLVGFLLSSLTVGGLAIPICSYTSPESRYTTLGLSFNYRFFDDQYRDNRNNMTSGSLALDFTNLFDSASYGYNVGVNTKISYNRGELSYSGISSGSYQMYLTEGDLFGFGSAVLRASSAYENPGLNVITGSGYGRFRDVTPLAKAMRIEETLLEMGSITGPLPDGTLTAIAQEIGRRIEYEEIERLVEKVAELIEGTGLVTAEEGKLGAVELLRIAELIEVVGDKRLCGFDFRGGLGYEVIDPMGGPQDFLAFAGFNYAFASDPNTQFLVKLDFTSSFEIFENYSLSGLATYAYRASPTLSYAASYTFLRTKQPTEEPIDSHLLDLKALFQAGAGWSLTADFSLKWESDWEEWSKEFSITANYTVF